MIYEEKNNIRTSSVFLGTGTRGLEEMGSHVGKKGDREDGTARARGVVRVMNGFYSLPSALEDE